MARETGRSTLAGIAAEAGVSVSAVSKVLNGRTDVAAGTRSRIAALLRRDGYHVASRLGFGVVMVFSASTIEATVTFHDPYYFLKKQGAYACVALLVMAVGPLVYAFASAPPSR